MTNDGTLDTTDTNGVTDTTAITDGANFVLRPVSRRLLIGGGAALGVGLTALGSPTAEAAPGRLSASWNGKSSRAAIRFLKGVTNAYRTTGPRLAQSYQDNSGLSDIAFVYDNALAIIALLNAGEGAAARALGDGLLYAQAHDETFTDGRLRQAYHANTFIHDNGTAHFGWEFGLVGTAVGDMSWAGIALAQLARATGIGRYKTGAVKIADWIQTNTYSTSGLGGYTFGDDGRAGGPQVDRAQHRRGRFLPADPDPDRQAGVAGPGGPRLGVRRAGLERRGRLLLDRLATTAARSTSSARSSHSTPSPGPGWLGDAARTGRRWTGRRPTSPPPTPRSDSTPR